MKIDFYSALEAPFHFPVNIRLIPQKQAEFWLTRAFQIFFFLWSINCPHTALPHGLYTAARYALHL